MPIRIPDKLPARQILEAENIFVMTERRAMHQDIRPLRVLLLNLMPAKEVTETQILRRLSNTPLQIEVGLMYTSTHESRNVSAQHLNAFYTTFDQVRDDFFDGLIITGAPVELLEFEDVDYWDELRAIMDWSRTNVHSTLHICWGAQAGIYHHYGVPKHVLPAKRFGVFEHSVVKPSSPLVRGFDERFWAPHSRYTDVRAEDIEAHPDLELIAVSDEAGVYAAKSTDSRHFFVFGHPEYDSVTLANEYWRDRAQGLDIAVPAHYYPGDNPNAVPVARWKAHGQLLYSNWLNYYVYQTTPYDISTVGAEAAEAKDEAGGSATEAAEAGSGTAEAAASGRAAAEAKAPAPARAPRYTLRPVTTPIQAADGGRQHRPPQPPMRAGADASDPFLRPENEDDDGYDPFSDRPPAPEPAFEADPWR